MYLYFYILSLYFIDILKLMTTNYLNIVMVVFLVFTFLILIQLNHWNFNPEVQPPKLVKQIVVETMENSDAGIKMVHDVGKGTDMDINLEINPSSGFCDSYRGKSDMLEQACSRLNKNKCLQTSCCIYTDLYKCSAGTVDGPIYKTDLDGKLITHEYYYYNDKCYGDCPAQFVEEEK